MQNRVTPLSELIDTPARGLVYGNRGCLHDHTGRIRRRYNGKRWISCQLRFKDWQRGPLLQPGKFTGQSSADAIDAQLHDERVESDMRAQRHHDAPLDELPDGAFVLHDGAPHLVLGGSLLAWSAAGYSTRTPRPTERQARVITPPSLVAVLRTDWQSLVPVVHPSALAN